MDGYKQYNFCLLELVVEHTNCQVVSLMLTGRGSLEVVCCSVFLWRNFFPFNACGTTSGSFDLTSQIKACATPQRHRELFTHKYWSTCPQITGKTRHTCRHTHRWGWQVILFNCFICDFTPWQERADGELVKGVRVWNKEGGFHLPLSLKMNLSLMTFADSCNSIRSQSATAISPLCVSWRQGGVRWS